MMPVGQYTIGNYIKELLKNIEFGTDGEEELDEATLQNIVKHTIGSNPRSLKRLVNSLSLISIFSNEIDNENEDENETQNNDENLIPDVRAYELLFAIVCVQIAYPDIYDLLSTEPNLMKWDDKIVYEMTQDKYQSEEFEKEFETITKDNADFDEDWEKSLYKICFSKEFYRGKVHDISRVLSIIKDDIIQNFDDEVRKEEKDKIEKNIGQIIARAMSKTSITNITSTNTTQNLEREKGRRGSRTDENRAIMNDFWDKFYEKMEPLTKMYGKKKKFTWGWGQGVRVKEIEHLTNNFFHIDSDGGVRLYIQTENVIRNIALFDGLYKRKDSIEATIGLKFNWKPARSGNTKRQKIELKDSEFKDNFRKKYNCDDEKYQGQFIPHEGWDEVLNWHAKNIPLIERTFVSNILDIEEKELGGLIDSVTKEFEDRSGSKYNNDKDNNDQD